MQADAALPADKSNNSERKITLICLYAALCCLIGVKAVVAQALPIMLTEMQAHPECVAETLSTVAAGSAALEFALLPIVASLSDTYGRRPLLVALPVLVVLLRLLVVLRPCLQTTKKEGPPESEPWRQPKHPVFFYNQMLVRNFPRV